MQAEKLRTVRTVVIRLGEHLMTRGRCMCGIGLLAGSLAMASRFVSAQDPEQSRPPVRTDRSQLKRPVYRVAQSPDPRPGQANLPQSAEAPAGEHPLVPALNIAYGAMQNIQN